MKSFFLLTFLAISIINSQSSDFLNNSTISFDFSSVEKIYFHPEEVLEDMDKFWETDVAYQHSKTWHNATKIDVPLKNMKKQLRKKSKMSVEKRKKL
jgi:hypothetical protein